MQSMTGSPATPFPFAGSAALTSFIGRRQELEEAAAQMRTCRLLTLTGPGGVGKTRLAVELARQSQDCYADGVFMADLGSVEEHSGVLPALLAALRVPDQSPRPASEKLIEHLREKNLLLVLDNCEHLLESTASTVPQLLHQAPALSIIATSREPLGITGEQAYPVPPLGILGEVLAGGEAMVHSEAVQLLLDRARSIVPDFELTEENQDAIAQLCVQLDGIPLAIELAAPRLRSLSVTELVERLDQRFRLLAGSDRSALPRQKSMSALLGWSYELCTEAEQKLWARISVFPGGFDLAAAEYVCGFDGLESFEVIDLLDRLVAKSIVVVEPDGQRVRYRQLMTFRLYGAGLLDNAEEFEQAKIRQRDFYLQRAAKMVELWCGPGQAACLEAAKQDHPNLISVLEWSLNRPGELRSAASLAALLRYHWIAGGFLNSGRHWLERILVRLDESSLERGNALWVAAWICLIQGDRQAATGFLERCRQEAEQLQDEVLRAHAAHWQALNELFSGRLDAAIALFEQAIATHRDVEDTASMLTAQFQLAMAQSYQGDSLESLKTSDGALELSGERGDRWNHAYSWWIAGVGQFKSGQFSLAQESALKALELQREFKDGICTALSIELLSWIAVEEQQIEHAAVLFQAANCVWKGLGTSVEAFGPGIHADSMRAAESISAHTSTRQLAVSRLAGSALGKDAAIELALGRLASVKKSAQRGATQLTKRELEIAGLIEQGMSNRSMASKLVISQRTVDGHVERILNKLGFASRVQVATWSANRRSSPA